MVDKFLKKIIAQNQEDTRVISALCSEAKVKLTDIKFLKKNKIFLISLIRDNKEKADSKEKIKNYFQQHNLNNMLEVIEEFQ